VGWSDCYVLAKTAATSSASSANVLGERSLRGSSVQLDERQASEPSPDQVDRPTRRCDSIDSAQ
jgi:hypothetical protein